MILKTLFKIIIFCTTINFITARVPIQEIALDGLITNPKEEISGMDWYRDKLFFLPENLGGYLFMLTKQEIQSVINSKTSKILSPKVTKLQTPNYSNIIPGFDGFEAIAFNKNKVYLMIEAENSGIMEGYLVWGDINPKSYEINIDENSIQKIKTPIQIDNLSYESLLVYKKNLLVLFEANGINLRKNPSQFLISLDNFLIKAINAPNIEYRMTDATKIAHNKFWAINYYWPGDKKNLKPGVDQLNANDLNTMNNNTVERLVEFEIKNEMINFTNRKPINLILQDGASRNWEGIVRYGESGFLIATDKYPKMILAYIESK